VTTERDPRDAASDIRPVVARAQRRAPTWLLAAGVAIAGLGLFVFLEGRRQAAMAPAVAPGSTEIVAGTMAPPPLFIPVDPTIDGPPPPPPEPPSGLASTVSSPAAAPPSAPTPPAPPAATFNPFPPQPSARTDPAPAPSPGGGAESPALVIDTTAASPAPAVAEGGAEGGAAAGNDNPAVRTSRIRRPSTTVLQGTLIPAVIETALDSSRPGQVRAIVSRDITGFDGSRVLIPRGSRLVGNYEADLTDGQSRAFVEWTRLVRPDGVSIALGSPAADLQGRAGVPGRVNSHFLARFGSALLQTTLNLGASAAGRSLGGDSSVVVALPGATQNLGASASASTIKPTLRVAAGARVSVFVARDLEFSSGTPR
jgi:type IV secretion system protein VirB10